MGEAGRHRRATETMTLYQQKPSRGLENKGGKVIELEFEQGGRRVKKGSPMSHSRK